MSRIYGPTRAALRPPAPQRVRINDWARGALDSEGNIDMDALTEDHIECVEQAEQWLKESDDFRRGSFPAFQLHCCIILTRVGAATTVNRQDRHLFEYRVECMVWFVVKGKKQELANTNPNSTENDTLFFPEDHDKFYDMVKL